MTNNKMASGLNQGINQSYNQGMATTVAKCSGADSIALFLYDQSLQANAATFIYDYQIPAGLKFQYCQSLCKQDPLLPHDLSKALSMGEIGHSSEADFRQTESETAGEYWQHLSAEHYKETAACFRQLSSNMCLVIGLLKLSKPGSCNHLQVDRVLNNLDDWLKESSDQLISNSLRQCYQTDSITSGKNSSWDLLTKRQRQLVEILLTGKSNKQISSELNLSGYTVENHLRNIYRKFGVRNRTALAARFSN